MNVKIFLTKPLWSGGLYPLIPITLLLGECPAAGAKALTAPGGEGAQASRFDVKTPLAGEIPWPLCRLRAVTFWQCCRKVGANILKHCQEVVSLAAIGFDKIVRPDFHVDL